MTVWMAYTDDSGDATLSVHTALMVPVDQWSTCLRNWKKYRRALKKGTTVPPEWELHASSWITGKDQPAPKDAPVNTTVGIRHEWTRKALMTIGSMPDTGIFTVVSPTPIKADAYREFILALDQQLHARGDEAIVIMDGDPLNPDPHIHDVHRELTLTTRHIIEDGWIQDSAGSQFIQMADLIVHCAFQHQVRNPERRYMWNWYPDLMHNLEWACTCHNSNTDQPE